MPVHLILLAPFTAAAPAVTPPQTDTSTDAVVRAASAYVVDYQQRLTSVLADETYVQEISRQIPREPGPPRFRTMSSEVFFMFTPTNDWMTIRDVTTVDRKPVTPRPDIRRSLENLSSGEVAAALKAQNSRFNIGRILRNFSEPTLGLLVLDPAHRSRFAFERKSLQQEGDVVLVTLTLTERESPTLIADTTRGNIMSTGEIVVEARTGRVRDTLLRAQSGAIALELATRYRPEERLGMWVPSVFREAYERGVQPGSLQSDAEYIRVECEARYRNFRRFESSARIK